MDESSQVHGDPSARGTGRRVTRSNAEWLADLRHDDTRGPAAGDLRTYLRRALHRTLCGHGLGDHDLDDVLQDACVRIIDHLDEFRGDSRFTTWAAAVAIRVAFGVLRRRRREVLVGDDVETALAGGLAEADRVIDRRTIIGALHAAIRECLTDRQRTAVLGELAGVPTDELASRLGMSRNALYKLHHDARRKLRHAILATGLSEDEVRCQLADTGDASA